MDRIWLKSYAPGVPGEVDPDAWPSLPALIAESITANRDCPAFACGEARLSYGAFDKLSRNFAAYLLGRLKLKKGDRVALMLPNVLHYPVAMYGVLRAGLVVVNVNPLYSPRELAHQLHDAGAGTILVYAPVSVTLREVMGDVPVRNVLVARLSDFANGGMEEQPADPRIEDAVGFKEVIREGEALSLPEVQISGADLAFLQYTGGTTGRSKGAMLSHRNMVANVLQTHAAFTPNLEAEGEIYITALPLYHVFALTVNCLGCLHRGGLNVLITEPRDLPAMVQELSRWKFTFISGVNTLLNGLLHTPGFTDLDFSALRLTIAGGMALQSSVARKWQEVTGCPALEGYGLSETAPCVSCNPVTSTGYSGTIGVPLPSTELCIRDDEGLNLPPGTPGELCARGPQVMSGYWNLPEETRAVMTEDGFFRTGDIAVMDERGFFKIIDRKKDMINVSGFNVFPNEVEDVVASMNGVRECACIGIPDERTGEAVMLFIVPAEGVRVGEQEILKWCRGRLAPYKLPRRIEFCEAIPKSNVGKILRRELRDSLRSRN